MYLLLLTCLIGIVLIDNQKDIYLNLPPLLFAILYDKVTTLSCPTSESPWTISRLSPSLSSLAPTYLPSTNSIPFSTFPPLKQVKIALFRRVLTHPLYRSVSVAEKVWKDTIRCLAGKRAVLRLLLSARTIFMDGGDWSIFSRIIWEDYIIWCQGCSERVLQVLAEEMGRVRMEVREIGFGLEKVEE
jgi:protein SHQ1